MAKYGTSWLLEKVFFKKYEILNNIRQHILTCFTVRDDWGLKKREQFYWLNSPYQQWIREVRKLWHQDSNQGTDHNEHRAHAQYHHWPVGYQGCITAEAERNHKEGLLGATPSSVLPKRTIGPILLFPTSYRYLSIKDLIRQAFFYVIVIEIILSFLW